MIDLNPKFKIGEIVISKNNSINDLEVVGYHPNEYRTYYKLMSESLGRVVMIHIDTVEKLFESKSNIRNCKIDKLI